jgi:hypothetical protein
MRSLLADEESTRKAACEVLATWAGTEHDGKDHLLRFLKGAPSPSAASTALYALGKGWAHEADVGALAETGRQSGYAAVALEAIRIRAKRMEADTADFERFFDITHGRRSFYRSRNDRDLLEHFATTQRQRFVGRLLEGLEGLGDRNRHDSKHLLASLVICDPKSSAVSLGLLELFQQNGGLHDLLVRGEFPMDRVIWTPELILQVERSLTQPDAPLRDYELYHLSKVLRTDVLKVQLLGDLRHGKLFRFWAARALVESWGRTTPRSAPPCCRFSRQRRKTLHLSPQCSQP